MATNSKIFVSPGVYTSEVDLSFVAQSVGVTTLGIAGETLKGPAFEPIFIRNYEEFQSYFGGTSPEKFVNTQIPKYEAAYIAKSYLQQSNQLFVSRILGLSGYDAGPSWSITTSANVDPTTINPYCLSAVTPSGSCEPVCILPKTIPFTVEFTGCTNGVSSVIFESFPDEIEVLLNEQYEQFNGNTSTLLSDLQFFAYQRILNPATEETSIAYFGSIDGDDYDILSSGYTASTNVFNVPSPSASLTDFTSPFNDTWYYALFENIGNAEYSGFSFWSVVSGLTNINPITTSTTTPAPTPEPTPNPCITPTPVVPTTTTTTTVVDCFSGTMIGMIYVYSGMAYTNYDDLVVATLRSRGISTYSDENNPRYEITGITDVTMDCTGQYESVLKNPFAKFAINATNYLGNNFTFVTSFSTSDSEYISKVFGGNNFGKPRNVVPLFVEERFQTMLRWAYNKGYIRGLKCDLISLPEAQSEDPTSIGWYLERYQSPESPWVVSEVRGSKVYNLFKFYTISDGNSANTEVKISISDISFANETFTVLVRDYYDTDSNPVVLEKYTNCSMNPQENNFIAKKVGTLDGEFELKSRYIMVEMNEDAPIDALPCGFEGYNFREYSGGKSPFPIFKTKYDFPGELVFNPPFGTPSGTDDAGLSSGDNIRKTFLGFSTSADYGYDPSFFEYVGKRNPSNICFATESSPWLYRTRGFHMDKNASGITISNGFSTSGEPRFYVGSADFSSEPVVDTNPYYRLFARKFTLLVQGGFDGWDIYRERRTNEDKYVLGRTGYLNGACATTRYPNAVGWGAFKQISVGDGTTDYANTDYYAYLLGIRTFSNPEAVNINLFVTPGIDYVNNSNLVESTIEMIETERADSLYITTTPDYNLLLPTTTGADGLIYPQEAVDNLEETGIDSNYTATYYPWVLTRDSVNNTQIYIPPTAEVTRNLALTDNIAFPWFAAAGYTRGIVNSIKARKKLTQEDRDVLYLGRINPIATFSDVGTVIWGNKTLQVRESALDRINVRRLLLQARKLISAVSVRLLFDQNDEKVRQDFLNAVNPILDGIRRDRGLYDFRVTVSNDTADLDRNQMTGKIYIKPTRSLEFIDITFYITPTGASFEDV
jgi:hypothetical protein